MESKGDGTFEFLMPGEESLERLLGVGLGQPEIPSQTEGAVGPQGSGAR